MRTTLYQVVLFLSQKCHNSKFLKLNSSHPQYVIGCMQNTTAKITNVKAYMATELYSVPNV